MSIHLHTISESFKNDKFKKEWEKRMEKIARKLPKHPYGLMPEKDWSDLDFCYFYAWTAWYWAAHSKQHEVLEKQGKK